jgi:Ca2+-binding RTX toxin-like protein
LTADAALAALTAGEIASVQQSYFLAGAVGYTPIRVNTADLVRTITPDPGETSISAEGDGLREILVGNGGANHLYDNGKPVTLDGRLGDDSYHVNTAGTVVIEKLGAGIDTVVSAISYTLPANVENLTLSGGNGVGPVNGTGNALDNVISGNDFANLLTGGAGNDTLDGKGGDDTAAFAHNFNDSAVEDFGGKPW